MNRMFGFFCCAWAVSTPSKSVTKANGMTSSQRTPSIERFMMQFLLDEEALDSIPMPSGALIRRA